VLPGLVNRKSMSVAEGALTRTKWERPGWTRARSRPQSPPPFRPQGRPQQARAQLSQAPWTWSTCPRLSLRLRWWSRVPSGRPRSRWRGRTEAVPPKRRVRKEREVVVVERGRRGGGGGPATFSSPHPRVHARRPWLPPTASAWLPRSACRWQGPSGDGHHVDRARPDGRCRCGCGCACHVESGAGGGYGGRPLATHTFTRR